MRKRISDSFTYNEYRRLGDGLKAVLDLTSVVDINIPELLDYDVVNIIKMEPNESELLRISNTLFKRYKEHISRRRVYADEFMVAYTSKFLKINIVVVADNGVVTSGTQLIDAYPTIFVYNISQVHYEPLFGINGQKIFSWDEVKQILKYNRSLLIVNH